MTELDKKIKARMAKIDTLTQEEKDRAVKSILKRNARGLHDFLQKFEGEMAKAEQRHATKVALRKLGLLDDESGVYPVLPVCQSPLDFQVILFRQKRPFEKKARLANVPGVLMTAHEGELLWQPDASKRGKEKILYSANNQKSRYVTVRRRMHVIHYEARPSPVEEGDELLRESMTFWIVAIVARGSEFTFKRGQA